MRTTLSIDDDLLALAKERARREHRSVGEVISEAARATLTTPRSGSPVAVRNGFPQLPRRGSIMTNEMVDRIRDEIGV